jgi:hypothetical protein
MEISVSRFGNENAAPTFRCIRRAFKSMKMAFQTKMVAKKLLKGSMMKMKINGRF